MRPGLFAEVTVLTHDVDSHGRALDARPTQRGPIDLHARPWHEQFDRPPDITIASGSARTPDNRPLW
jgi:hypothetical protein